EQLAKSDASTAEQVEQARTRAKVAESQLEAVNAAVMKAKNLARPEDVRTAHVRVAPAEATRDRIREMVAQTEIVAPESGIVTHKLVEQGELVSPGAAIATVVEIDKVY